MEKVPLKNMNVPSQDKKKLEWWKKGECIPGEGTGTSKGVEEDYLGKFPIRYKRVVKIPAQISGISLDSQT